MFNNATNIDASHSTFSEVHRDQHIYSRQSVQGNQTVNTIVHGNQIFQGSLGLASLHRSSVPAAAFDSIDRHPAPTCLPGTRQSILGRITEWVNDPNTDQRMCWMSGLAGSGKSAVAQSIAEKYADQHRLAASFFFSRKEILRRKAQGFFPTLACQLLAFAPFIKPALLDVLDADATIPTKVLLEQAHKLLQEPIMSSANSFPDPILIVVDSLDECDNVKMVNEIVHLLSGILDQCRWPLKILFTSRAEPHIFQTFQHPELQGMTWSLQLQDFDVDNDIRTYLHCAFEGIRESMDGMSIDYPSPWPSDDEIEMIVQKAAGLFIFATTVVKYLGTDHGSPVVQLQAVLQVLHNSASVESALVHSTLDTLYLDALQVVPDVEKVRTVLGSVVYAFRPLSIRGLNDLLWNTQYNTSYIVKNLCSVLVVSSDIENNGAVCIHHTSFRDFLTSSRRSRQYFVDPVVFHRILARACLELMIRNLTVDMCTLGDPSILNCEVEDLGERCKHNIREGVRYACRWFAHHLSHIPWDQKTDNGLVLCLQAFANTYLLSWIEVLSLTGELHSAVLSLREATFWLKCSPQPHEEILTLFRDAERLVLMFYDPIQQAALQVYYSLPNVPTSVQIRTTYARELKNKFVVTYGLDKHWKYCLRSVTTGTTIKSLAVSTSGCLIASAGDTPGVQLWDTLTGNNTGHFPSAGTSTCSVVFSPSGDYVAIGCDTGGIDVWDVTTGHGVLDSSQELHSASVTILAFSRNSLFIASGAADATIHVWDISARSLKHSLTYHAGSIPCLVFSSSDGLIASGSDDATIVTSDVRSGQRVRIFRGHTSKVNTIAFSPDSESIASGSDDQTVRLWDTRTGVCLRAFSEVHKKPIRQVWFTADNKYAVSVCNIDVYMSEANSTSRKSPQRIWSAYHYYRKLGTMFPAWYAKVARLFPASIIARFSGIEDNATLYTAHSSDGNTIGCAFGPSLLFLEHFAPQRTWSKVRHPLTSSTLDEPPLCADDSEDKNFDAIAIALDATLLVTSIDGIIQMWNTSPKSDWKTFQNEFKKATDGFWPALDGHSLLVKPIVGLQLVIPTGELIKDLETGGDSLSKVGAVPSPDSKYFAYWAEYAWNVDKSFSIYIYNASTGARLKRIPGFFDITCGKFSSKSDLLACAHGAGVVQIWELPSGLCKTTITTGHAAITALELLPDSITLVVGSDKGCVEIRLVESGEVVHRVECTVSKVLALAVPREALVVVIGQEDGSMFLWDPSRANVAPHCLSQKVDKDMSDGDVNDPDGIDFIKFAESYRSICTRSLEGVICTWDLAHCLAEYVEEAPANNPEVLVEGAVAAANATPAHVSPQPSNLVDSSEHPDGSTSLTTCHASISSQDDTITPSDVTSAHTEFTSPVGQDNTSEPGSPAKPDMATTFPASLVPTPSCPHLVSRSDSHIVYDRYLRSPYSIDGRGGWVCHGSRRLFWLPSDLRPASPTALSAFEDRLVILARSRRVLFIDMRPMVDPIPTPT